MTSSSTKRLTARKGRTSRLRVPNKISRSNADSFCVGALRRVNEIADATGDKEADADGGRGQADHQVEYGHDGELQRVDPSGARQSSSVGRRVPMLERGRWIEGS